VNAGFLQAGAANAFAVSSAFTVASGATLDLNNFNQTIGSLAGAGNVTLGSATLTTGSDGTSTTYSGAISGTGGLTKIGGGTFVLSGTSSYTGATTINGGTLEVDGSIASSPSVTVNAGGTLSGTGIVDPAAGVVIAAGGMLAPGNAGNPTGTLTITGNLAFQSGAIYLVQVNPTSASRTNVAGAATLTGGSVQAVFAPGGYVTRSYDILHATGGLVGTFSGVSGNVPAGFTESLSYTSTDVLLNLTGSLGTASGLNQNQQNVANALNNFFNNGGTLPPNFLNVFFLTGGNLGNVLTQLSGEVATGAQQGAFKLMDQFVGLMLDPFVDGRRGPAGGGGPALGFAPESDTPTEEIARAFADLKSPLVKAPPVYEPRWTAWAGGFGGSSKTNGDPAVIGSHDLTATDAGFAAGLDYHWTRDTVVGFALAGAGTNWSLAQGLGGGKSDAFQAGFYGSTRWGPAYVAAAFAFADYWMSTDRFAAFADHLTARFNAQSYGWRAATGSPCRSAR
jgi:autotransporter-associated beta strand protein